MRWLTVMVACEISGLLPFGRALHNVTGMERFILCDNQFNKLRVWDQCAIISTNKAGVFAL